MPHLTRLLATTALATASALAVLPPGPAQAISVRDDVATAAGGIAAYYDKANAYPNVGSLRMGGQSSCTGTLLNARTLLTATHCFEVEKAGQEAIVQADLQGPQMQVSFNPVSGSADAVAVQSVVVRPDQRPAEGNLGFHDIAIVALGSPITGVSPVTLATGQPARGGTVLLAGYGGAFTGSAPAGLIYDSRRRVAYNVLDFVGPGTGLPVDSDGMAMANNALVVLAADFDNPDNAAYSSLGTATALKQEGSGVAGDSGGPLFLVQADGSLVQVGVLSGGDATRDAQHSSAAVGGNGYTGYGDMEIWTNVAFYLDWLSSNAFLKEVSAVAGDGAWSSAAHWSGGAVPNNSSGYVKDGAARYYNVSLNQAGTTTLDMNASVDSLTVNNSGAALTLGSGYTLNAVVGTTLAAGTVTLGGSLATPWLKLTGGTLAGSGIVSTTNGVSQTGGTVSPGGQGAIGTITVSGAFNQTGGALLAEVASGAADSLTVAGAAANLAGSLQIGLLGETPPDAGSRFTVVSAGSLSAATLADPAPVGAVTFTLERSATDLTVVVGRRALTAIGADDDQDAAAAALDGQRANPVFEGVFDALDDLPEGQIRQALEEIGEAGTTAGATSRTGSAQFLGAGSQRVAAVRLGLADSEGESRLALQALSGMPFSPDGLAEASWRSADAAGPARLARPGIAGPVDGLGSTVAQGPALSLGTGTQLAGLSGADTRWGGWLQPYGTRTLRRGDDAGSRYNATLGGAAAGIDYRLQDNLVVGVSIGYARSEIGYLDSASQGHMRSYQAGLYGGWWDGPWSVEGGLGLALNRYENNREIAFGTIATAAESKYGGRELSGYAETGYRFDLAVAGRPLELRPSASLQALRIATDAYTETGAGALNLSVAADRIASVKSGLGLSLGLPFVVADGHRLKPEIRGRWLHEFADTNVSVDSTFAVAGGAAFQVSSDSLGRDSAILGTGLEAELAPQLALAAGYDVQLQSGLTIHAVSARLRVAF